MSALQGFPTNCLGRQEEYRLAIFNREVIENILVRRFVLKEDLKLVRSGSCGYLEKSLPDRGSNTCKSPEAQRCPVSKKPEGHHDESTARKQESSG